jgi:hypothetical protein
MTPPRIFCDFNKALDGTTFSLNTSGSRADIARLQKPLIPGMEVVLCDEDVDEKGKPSWLVADAVVVSLPDGKLAARISGSGFRREPREPALGDTLVGTKVFPALLVRLMEAGWDQRPLRFRIADVAELDFAGAQAWVTEAAEEGYINVRYVLTPQCSGAIVVDLAAHAGQVGTPGITPDVA